VGKVVVAHNTMGIRALHAAVTHAQKTRELRLAFDCIRFLATCILCTASVSNAAAGAARWPWKAMPATFKRSGDDEAAARRALGVSWSPFFLSFSKPKLWALLYISGNRNHNYENRNYNPETMRIETVGTETTTLGIVTAIPDTETMTQGIKAMQEKKLQQTSKQSKCGAKINRELVVFISFTQNEKLNLNGEASKSAFWLLAKLHTPQNAYERWLSLISLKAVQGFWLWS
jgi:hypothetical protein